MELTSERLLVLTSQNCLLTYSLYPLQEEASITIPHMVTCLTVEETEAMVGLDSGDVIVVGIREGSLCLSGHWVAPPSAASAIQRLLIVGEMVCAFSVDGAIQVWWRSGGTHLWSLPGPEELLCWAVQLSPQKPWTETGDTLLLAAGGWDCAVWLWDAVRGLSMAPVAGHTEAISCIKWVGTDSCWLLTGSFDGTVRVWHCHQQLLQSHMALTAEKEIYCVDADRFMIAAAGSSSDVLVWDWTGQHLHSLAGHLGVVRHLHIKPSPAARPCLVSAGDMRRIIVWRPDLAPPDHVLHRNPAQVGTFLLNDFYIIVAAHSGTPGFVLLSFI